MQSIGIWLTESAATLGPAGAFVVALGDSAFVPLPQGVDALLVAQALAAPSGAWLAAGLAVAGSVLGSLVLYWLARRGGRALLERRLSAASLESLEDRTRRYGATALVPPMMLPLPLPTKIFVLAAGVFQMPLKTFLIATAAARSVRYFGATWLTLQYGDQTAQLLKENVGVAIVFGAALLAFFFWVRRWSFQRLAADR